MGHVLYIAKIITKVTTLFIVRDSLRYYQIKNRDFTVRNFTTANIL
jgi:hypothetical protein